MALKPGTHLGPYEVLSLIGAGGMGEVYKGRDTRLDRIVAIKTLPAHLAERPELRERFKREASTLANLKHAHICVLFDIGKQTLLRQGFGGQAVAGEGVGEQQQVDYLVLEYLEGETLAQRLAKGPLSPPPTRANLRAEVSYNQQWCRSAYRSAKWKVSKTSFSPYRWMRNPARPVTWSTLGAGMQTILGTSIRNSRIRK